MRVISKKFLKQEDLLKKKEKKIAYWYFQQLCKLWRKGIYIYEGKMNKNQSGRWDHKERWGL